MTVSKALEAIERNTGIMNLELNGKEDYSTIQEEVGANNLKSLASKTGVTVNRLVWSIRDHITENKEADDWAK